LAPDTGRAPVRRFLIAIAATASIAVLPGCSDPPADACPEPKPGGDASVLPDGIRLQRFGTLTESKRQGDFLSAAVIAESSVDELYQPLLEHVRDAGYSVLNSENEHFEAEIFFGHDEGAVALMSLREGPCRGQVTIRLTYG
jgi:hypothetical protein